MLKRSTFFCREKNPCASLNVNTDNSISALSQLLNQGQADNLDDGASRALHLKCSHLRPQLATFLERDGQYDNRPRKLKPNLKTKLSADVLKMRQAIEMMSQEVKQGEADIAELRQHAQGPVAFVSAAAKERLGARQNEFNETLLKSLSAISQNLPDLNSRLKKAIDQAGSERSQAQKTVFKGNISSSWEEALEAIDTRSDFAEGCNMDFFSYQEVKSYLDDKANSGVTYFTIDELLVHLNKPVGEKRGLRKLIMKYLPIVQIEEGKQSLFMDARICLAKPENIFHLVNIDKCNDAAKGKSGRPKGSFKINEEHVAAMKKFIESSCTVSANERRQNDVNLIGGSKAGLGTTWTEIHQHLADKFFTGSLQWSKKTSRRVGLPPNNKATARKYYRGEVNAKPQTLSNNRPLRLHAAAKHCHVNVRYVMEWASLFPDLVTTVSADNKVLFKIVHF